ncbi:PREDICTED: vacuolar protein sorting-associated protein 13A-like [Priapulus caudatus]|uniref:Vacuolar protein sorting-associated protein 13A-like n=1 Tax=Priapulus caudatus TaxID=37621 RepID=A0ABM1DQP9_PRICU|nr:PREDICTED: vacuolar protein sorting-associated protein 13A-like [Priapulus caudatus]
MVFESLVADLLNRFLGDYVENLDSSQLSIGIWGERYSVTGKGAKKDVAYDSRNSNQYLDVMEFLEGLERMGRSALYQKFHPGAGVPIKGNAKKYWHFAMNSIMEDVRRRLRQKSWMHIADHRKRVKAYQAAYKKKLLAKKVSKELQTELDGCEKSLDVLNITLARQQARTEVTREEAKNENKGGWLSGWWGGGKKEEKAAKGTTEEIAEKFGEAMTPEEKAKLFDAIGYSENQVDTTLPQEFVAMQLKFHLKNLSVSLKEPTRKSPQIVKLAFTDAVANVDQRPSAEAIKVDASIASMAVYGVPAGDSVPHLVTTQTDGAGGGVAANLLSVMFETNPLDKQCDQRVKLLARPLEIVYNAATINQVADFFKPPESVHLSQLQAAAASKLDELKEMSATGLQHAVEHHKYMDLNIDIQPSYVIVPENGVYSDSAHLLVLDLGALTMRSVKDKRPMLPRVGSTEKEVMDDLKSRSYDKFDIALQRVQVMFAEPGDDWKVARGEADSSLQLLKPFDLNVQLHKGLIVDDPRLPKVRVLSELPNLAISVSDHKLQQIARLAASIPTPEPAAAPPAEAVVPDAVAVDDGDAERIARRAAAVAAAAKKKQEGPAEQLTDIELRFELRRFAVSVCRRVETHDVGIVAIAVEGVVVEAAVRTYEMRVGARVGGVSVRHLQFNGADGAPVALVGTPAAGRDDVDLVSATYVRANRAGPEFATTYGNAEQAVAVTFSRLDVTMHRGALLHLMQFGKDFGEKMAAAVPSKPEVAAPPPPDDAGAPKPIVAAASRTTLAAVPLSEERRRRLEEIIELQLEARLGSIAVSLCDDDGAVAALTLSGLHAGVTMRRESIAVAASLRDVVVADPTPGAAHPRIISTVGGEELLSAHVRQYARATDGDAYADMDAADLVVELSVAQLRVVVLARFLGDVAAFAAAFQSEAAQRAIADAGAAAAESAAEAATNLQIRARSRRSLPTSDA